MIFKFYQLALFFIMLIFVIHLEYDDAEFDLASLQYKILFSFLRCGILSTLQMQICIIQLATSCCHVYRWDGFFS